MRRRPIKVTSYYTEEEYQQLCTLCKKIGLGKADSIKYLEMAQIMKNLKKFLMIALYGIKKMFMKNIELTAYLWNF